MKVAVAFKIKKLKWEERLLSEGVSASTWGVGRDFQP